MSNKEYNQNHHKGHWIPVELDRFGLSNTEKLFLSIIDSLDSPVDHCYASNEYFADQMGLSISRITYYLTKFKRMGLIEQLSFSGRVRVIRVCKENWYAKEVKNSKKESCVKTSRQTTRKRVGRLRENEDDIIKNIEKTKTDDGPASAGDEKPMKKKLFFRHQTKNVISKDLDEIYQYLRSKGFFETEIEEAIREADDSNPVLKADNFNVIERYLATMIEKKREHKLKEKRRNDTKQTPHTHNRQQDSLQRSRESFTKQIDALGPEARRPGVWSLDG